MPPPLLPLSFPLLFCCRALSCLPLASLPPVLRPPFSPLPCLCLTCVPPRPKDKVTVLHLYNDTGDELNGLAQMSSTADRSTLLGTRYRHYTYNITIHTRYHPRLCNCIRDQSNLQLGQRDRPSHLSPPLFYL